MLTPDTETFRFVIDLIRAVYNEQIEDMVAKTGQKRHVFDNLKRGTKSGDMPLLMKFIETYPMIKPYVDLYAGQKPNNAVPSSNLYYISSKARAAYTEHPSDPDWLKHQPALFLPSIGPGIHRGFEVVGNSMEPTLHHGDQVICEYVDYKTAEIKNGQVHVVVTPDDVLIKRIQNRLDDRGRLVLSSDNKEDFRTYSIEKKEILEMWRVRMFISYQLRDPARDYMKAQEIEADMALLREDVESELESMREELEELRASKPKDYTKKSKQ